MKAKSPFGWNRSVLFGDRFYCKKRVLSVLKRKETSHLYGGAGRSRSNRTGSKSYIAGILAIIIRIIIYICARGQIVAS